MKSGDFGVRAVLIEPAYTKTKISGNDKSAKVALEVYAAERKRMTNWRIEKASNMEMILESWRKRSATP